MKIKFTNFLCYNNNTFEFGNKGLTLILGSSGTGKTSRLRGIYFALYGIGTKLQTYGKTSMKVEFEFDTLNIVRTKRPNRLIVNNIYEDEVGQEIINIIPTMIREDEDGWLVDLKTDPMIWCTIRSVQELYTKYKLNFKKVKEREEIIERLKQKQNKLEEGYLNILKKLNL